MKISTKNVKRLELALGKAEERLTKAATRYENALAKVYVVSDCAKLIPAQVYFAGNLAAAVKYPTNQFWQNSPHGFGRPLEYVGERLENMLIRAKLAFISAVTDKAAIKAKLAEIKPVMDIEILKRGKLLAAN